MKVNDDLSVLALHMQMGDQKVPIYASLIHDAAKGPTLVDTGVSRVAGGLDEALAEEGLKVADLKRIILTHQDVDHTGALRELVNESGAETLAHEVEAPYIDGRKPRVKIPSLNAFDHMPQLRSFFERLANNPTPIDTLLHDNDRLDLAGGVRVIFTPGHTPGHISLYLERTRTLITGDALALRDGQVDVSAPQMTLDTPLAWESARKLATLDVQTLVCFHGGVLTAGVNEQLQRLATQA